MAGHGSPSTAPRWSEWGVVAVLALGAIAFWWLRIEGTARTHVFEAVDLFGYFLPAYTYEARRLRELSLALWNPYQGGGQPFLAQLQPAVLYPARLLLVAFDVPQAMRLSILGHVLLALVATYRLAMALAIPRAGAALSAIVFTAGWALPNLFWPSALEPGAWLPVAACAAVGLAQTGERRWALLLGLACGLPLLAGGYQTSVYLAYGVAVILAGLVIDPRTRSRLLDRRGLASLAIAGGLALATAAPQLLPTLLWSGESVRSVTALGPKQIDDAADPQRVVASYFVNRSIDRQSTPLSPPVAALAVLGWISGGAFANAIGLVGLAFFALALGSGTPWFWLHDYVPGFSVFHSPERLGFLVAFFAALGAGFGVRCIARAHALGRIAGPLAMVAAAVAGVVMLWPIENRSWLPWKPPPQASEQLAQTNDFLRETRGEGRALAVNGFGLGFLPRQGLVAAVPFLQDYEPLSSRRLARLLSAVLPAAARDLAEGGFFYGLAMPRGRITRMWILDTLAVDRLFLSEAKRPPSRPVPLERLGAQGGLAAYRNPGALPRAYLLETALVAPNAEAALAILQNGAPLDFRRTAILAGPLPGSDPLVAALVAPGRAESGVPAEPRARNARKIDLTIDEPEHLVADVDVDRPSLLIVADAFAPGWTAAVDGKPRRLWQANYFVRGVAVGPGDHRVELRYRPPGFGLGLALAGVAWSVAILGNARRTRRRYCTPAAGTLP